MKYKITESQYRRLIKENVDDILDRISAGENLRPSDKRKLNAYSKHLDTGGRESNFEYSDHPEYVEKEGKVIKSTLADQPIEFIFSEENELEDGIIEYSGKIWFGGNQYIGVIATDKSGYLIDYDFYDIDTPDERLRYVIEGLEHELDNFFQTEVIPTLQK